MAGPCRPRAGCLPPRGSRARTPLAGGGCTGSWSRRSPRGARPSSSSPSLPCILPTAHPRTSLSPHPCGKWSGLRGSHPVRGSRGGALRGPGAARLTRGGTADGRGLCRQGAAKALIFPVVQQFTEAFVQALQVPDGPTSDSGFKMEVLKVCAWDWGCPGAAAAPPASRATPGLVSASSGGDGPGEELPEAHGVLHAADPAHRLEHADRQRGFISFPGAAAGRLGGWRPRTRPSASAPPGSWNLRFVSPSL